MFGFLIISPRWFEFVIRTKYVYYAPISNLRHHGAFVAYALMLPLYKSEIGKIKS